MQSSQLIQACEQAVQAALRGGATAADAKAIHSTHLTASVRLGAPETIERAESSGIGLRVFVGQQYATLSTADTRPEALATLVENALAIAKAAPADPFAGLADAAFAPDILPDLELFDAAEPTMEQLQAHAAACEESGLSTQGITNSEGADASYSAYAVALVNSQGASFHYRTSQHALSCSLIAGEGERMQRDYAYHTTRFASDLAAPEILGAEAATRSFARLNPRKIPSQKVAVMFEPRVARHLLSAFASAINGAAIARGTSFLKSAMGEACFAPGIRIHDNPLLTRGLGSRPCDSEAVTCQPLVLVEGGVLQHWLLDSRSARQLGLRTTGHAVRGLASAPSPAPSNVYLEAGSESPEAMLKNLPAVFYVTETFGHGLNLITGDYSQGASGFWMVHGERHYAVSEVTIAGNLRDMFRALVPANDLAFRYAINSPSLLIEGMSLAGSA